MTGQKVQTSVLDVCRNLFALLLLIPLQRYIPLHQQVCCRLATCNCGQDDPGCCHSQAAHRTGSLSRYITSKALRSPMKALWHRVLRMPDCLTHDRHIPGACILSNAGTSLPLSPFAVHTPVSSVASSEAVHECFIVFTYLVHGAQVITPLVLTFLVLVLAAAVAVWTSASGVVVIWAMLVSIGLMGATTALLQGGLFGLAGLCPPIYVQARSSHIACRMTQTPAHVHPCCMHH